MPKTGVKPNKRILRWDAKKGVWVTPRKKRKDKGTRRIDQTKKLAAMTRRSKNYSIDDVIDNVLQTPPDISEQLYILVPEVLIEIRALLHSKNPSIRLRAAELILSKTVPDLKSIEVSNSSDIQGLVIVRTPEVDSIDGDVIP